MFFNKFITKKKTTKYWKLAYFRFFIGGLTAAPFFLCFIFYSIYSHHGLNSMDILVFTSFWLLFGVFFSIKEK